MAAWYYLFKSLKNNTTDGLVDLNRSHDYDALSNGDISTKCRVCLQRATVKIYSKENANTIIETLQTITEIEISKHDDNPKALCDVCYKFIKSAIAFQKIARRSDWILKDRKRKGSAPNQRKPLKEETFTDHSEEAASYHDDHDYDVEDNFNSKACDDKWLPSEDNANKIKLEDNEKAKQSSKVPCPNCNKLISQSYYKTHMTMHDPDHKKYICDVCGKSFRLQCAYYNHSLRHRNDFPFKCTLCPYKGRYKELLKNHMRTHTSDYRYMCIECPARFHLKSNLNRHMLKHKEPQYKCDTCNRAFHKTLMLQRHYEADHLGIKNHVCNLCGEAFGYRNAMMKHQRHIHKREKSLYKRMPSYLEAELKKQSEDMQQYNV